ncbi:PEP-CTERM sorting domain-containing protein [Terriglobus saanensis]|uniref:Ice-binding protein C-terminal domain-containing protein n=1 Tax=Terriglobus saanensis (strain ATCC BAA-1853 / DSM 23119 / SP1PR4) TaxID=401053 RepID=E8UXI0_TERSS|nr:PEP-CTERM sorting domain-containing protein [Terriglobus saanensis]ADV80844.1 protein of unknown function DUF1555 [Terriglobus saanensis SP1PR4]
MSVKRLLGAALLLATSAICHADTLKFTLSGTENGYFLLSSTPIPDSHGNSVMNFYNTSYTNSSGVTSPIKVAFIAALPGVSGGGGFYDDVDGTGFSGLQMYTGTQSNPIFAPAVYTFKSGRTVVETVTITKLASAVTPEPSSLLLLFTGMGAVAVAFRKRFMGQGVSLA